MEKSTNETQQIHLQWHVKLINVNVCKKLPIVASSPTLQLQGSVPLFFCYFLHKLVNELSKGPNKS